MARYGNRRETDKPLSEIRFEDACSLLEREDWNGAPTKLIADYVRNKVNGIEDIFLGDCSCTILPKDKESAQKLWELIMDDVIKNPEDSTALADEVDWLKIGDRWWLNLWWD